jgi:hypothetical protein
MDDIDKKSRSRTISILLALGFIGVIGLAARPLYRSAFAERAIRDAAIQNAMKDAKRIGSEDRLQELLTRLQVLEDKQKSRNTLKFGINTSTNSLSLKTVYNSSSTTVSSSAKSV